MWIHWLLYSLSMSLTLFRKLRIFKQEGGHTIKGTLLEFFFGTTISTTTTLTVVTAHFVVCAWYLGALGSQEWIPVHWSLSLFLGTVAELFAPRITEKVLNAFSNFMK